MNLNSLHCPVCNIPLVPREGFAKKAQCFDHCLRRCDFCRVGFSNSLHDPVQIWADPEANVPEIVRPGLDLVLSRSVNEINRANKRVKFGFKTSEDAVTWTVFRYLQNQNALARVAQSADHAVGLSRPRLLLWGVEVPSPSNGDSDIEAKLREISRELDTSQSRRTEPDVIVDFGAMGVVFIEVKFQSGHDCLRTNHRNWDRYLGSGFSDTKAVRQTGLYELTRNWRFATELAAGRPFTLVNLGPASLFARERWRLEPWSASLDEATGGRFSLVPWHSLLGSVPLEPWMGEFCKDRTLLEPSNA